MLPIKNRSNSIECLKDKNVLKAIQMNKILVFLYSPIKNNKTLPFKQNDAIHYVTYVTFCITTHFFDKLLRLSFLLKCL